MGPALFFGGSMHIDLNDLDIAVMGDEELLHWLGRHQVKTFLMDIGRVFELRPAVARTTLTKWAWVYAEAVERGDLTQEQVAAWGKL